MDRNTAVSWQVAAAIIVGLIAIVGFSIQLGSIQTHVLINGDRLSILETEHKELERSLAKLTASEIEQNRRLGAIDAHDLETRALESKLIERISKLEGKP